MLIPKQNQDDQASEKEDDYVTKNDEKVLQKEVELKEITEKLQL